MSAIQLGKSWTRFLVLLVCVGCSTSPQPTTDAGPVDASTMDVVADRQPDVVDDEAAAYPPPGPRPPVPQVIDLGGPTLTAPNVVPIFFQNDLYQSQVESFLGALATSTYWSATTGEYGVGSLSVAASIVVSDTPPSIAGPNDVASWLAGHLESDPSFPAVSSNNVYVVLYPDTTTLTDASGGMSCADFNDYHAEGQLAGDAGTSDGGPTPFVFAAIARCPANESFNALDQITWPLSQALVEAATNPLPTTNPAYASVDANHLVWNIVPGAQVGEMCLQFPQSFQRSIVGSFMVERTWSNASAKANHDPCVPVLATPYYIGAPQLTDMVTLDYGEQMSPTLGIQVPLNTSKTIDVELFSDGPIAKWLMAAEDDTFMTANAPELELSWDAVQGTGGEVLHLTITRIANGPYGGSEIAIYSELNGSSWNIWYGFVEN
jgi:hypothetical protein